MKIKKIETDSAPSAIGPYSQALSAGPLIFVSGQIGLDPKTGDFTGNRFSDQAKQALENMRQIVISGGCDMHQVVAVDVFLTDMGRFTEFNEIYGEFFSDPYPARAAVAVQALPKGALVEVKCVVFAGTDHDRAV
jgi:2-iminobutanoate/2-iminopropanoate deaminase